MGSIETDAMDPALISELRQSSRQLVREWGFLKTTAAGTSYTASVVHTLIEISKDEGITGSELCAPLNLDKSTVSRNVKKLVDAGEIEERFDGGAAGMGDGRVKRLFLTTKGQKTVGAVHTFGNHQVSTAVSKLPPTSSPSSILTGITAYAEALRSSRLNTLPSIPIQPSIPIPSPLEPEIHILPGYRLGLISSTIRMQLAYYTRFNFGLAFESLLASSMAELAPRLDGVTNQVWCAVQNDEIVGCVWIDGEFRFMDDDGIRRCRPALRFLIVAGHVQGKGVGRKLVGEAMRWCDERGWEDVELSTFKGLDAARKLYEANGFRDVGAKVTRPWGVEILQQCMVRKRGGVV